MTGSDIGLAFTTTSGFRKGEIVPDSDYVFHGFIKITGDIDISDHTRFFAISYFKAVLSSRK